MSNQGLDLGEAVLVQLRGALRDQHDAQAPRSAAADEIIGGVNHSAGLRVGHAALRREQVSLVNDELQRPGVYARQRFGEVGEEAGACAYGHSRGVDNRSESLASDEFRQAGAGALADIEIGVGPAENHDGITGRAGVGEQSQAPPDVGGVHDTEAASVLYKALGKTFGGRGLAAVGHPEDADVVAEGFAREGRWRIGFGPRMSHKKSCFRAFWLIAFFSAVGRKTLLQQLVELQVVAGGIGFEFPSERGRDAEVQRDDLLPPLPFFATGRGWEH